MVIAVPPLHGPSAKLLSGRISPAAGVALGSIADGARHALQRGTPLPGPRPAGRRGRPATALASSPAPAPRSGWTRIAPHRPEWTRDRQHRCGRRAPAAAYHTG